MTSLKEQEICEYFVNTIEEYCNHNKIVYVYIQIVKENDEYGFKIVNKSRGFNSKKFNLKYPKGFIKLNELKEHKDHIFGVEINLERNSLKRAKNDLKRKV